MILVDSPSFDPGACILTGSSVGPFVDTLVDLDDLPGYGRVYLAVSTVESLGQLVGMSPADERARNRRELEQLRSDLASERDTVARLQQAVASLRAAGYVEVEVKAPASEPEK